MISFMPNVLRNKVCLRIIASWFGFLSFCIIVLGVIGVLGVLYILTQNECVLGFLQDFSINCNDLMVAGGYEGPVNGLEKDYSEFTFLKKSSENLASDASTAAEASASTAAEASASTAAEASAPKAAEASAPKAAEASSHTGASSSSDSSSIFSAPRQGKLLADRHFAAWVMASVPEDSLPLTPGSSSEVNFSGPNLSDDESENGSFSSDDGIKTLSERNSTEVRLETKKLLRQSKGIIEEGNPPIKCEQWEDKWDKLLRKEQRNINDEYNLYKQKRAIIRSNNGNGGSNNGS
jgi:hypothetical protein